MKKKVISCAIIGTILLTPFSMQINNGALGKESINLTENKVEAARPWLKKLIWPIINKLGNAWYNVPASYTIHTYGDKISPGSIAYNSGDYGFNSKFDFNFASTNHSMWLYADTTILNWGTKIGIILTDPNNNDVVSKSVDSGQVIKYRPTRTGTHTARYGMSKKQTWTPWIIYYYDTSGLPANSELGVHSDFKSFNESNTIETENYGTIFIPSNEHSQQRQDKYSLNSEHENTKLTALELDNQFFDNSLSLHVYSMKDYGIGDTVYFSDTIQDLEYEKNNNETFFKFSDSSEDYNFRFSGDHTALFNKGDTLNLKLEVQRLIDNEDLEILDYLKYVIDNKGKAPDLDKYLVE